MQLHKFNRRYKHRFDPKKYPPNWYSEIRPRILKRAGNKCELCGIKNYALSKRGTKVILTIAHLDHDPENWEVKDERLMALCQACHLNYDNNRHVAKRRYGRNYDGKQQLKIRFK